MCRALLGRGVEARLGAGGRAALRADAGGKPARTRRSGKRRPRLPFRRQGRHWNRRRIGACDVPAQSLGDGSGSRLRGDNIRSPAAREPPLTGRLLAERSGRWNVRRERQQEDGHDPSCHRAGSIPFVRSVWKRIQIDARFAPASILWTVGSRRPHRARGDRPSSRAVAPSRPGPVAGRDSCRVARRARVVLVPEGVPLRSGRLAQSGQRRCFIRA
jgi:hypothetical protein